MKPSLEALGYDAFFSDQILPKESGLLIGRAAFESRGLYQVLMADGSTLNAGLKGILRKGGPDRADYPVVGDWLLMERMDPKHALIKRTLIRRNAVVRREQSRHEAGRRASSYQTLAANVDWGLITTSLNEDWNPRRLERYLGLVRESGAKPAILLTKSDLADDGGKEAMDATRELAKDAPVLLLSMPEGQGLMQLRKLLAGHCTAVLLGSSGVGKSTLVNAMLGDDIMAVMEIREKDGRGRHTTVGRHLLALPGGGCLIDSPGLRDLGLVDEASVDLSFDDILELSAKCRFSDCRHGNEPGCAVRAALEDGSLDPARWEAYLKLREETLLAEKRRELGSERLQRGRGRSLDKLKDMYKKKGG